MQKIPTKAVEIYRMLPEGTRCEVIFGELVFPEIYKRKEGATYIPDVPVNALEVFRMLPEGTRCEVIFNELNMSPSPSSQHQFLLAELHGLLYTFLKEEGIGEAVLSPFDVYFENDISVVQPDVIVLLNEALNKVKKTGFMAPLTSPSKFCRRMKATIPNANVRYMKKPALRNIL